MRNIILAFALTSFLATSAGATTIVSSLTLRFSFDELLENGTWFSQGSGGFSISSVETLSQSSLLASANASVTQVNSIVPDQFRSFFREDRRDYVFLSSVNVPKGQSAEANIFSAPNQWIPAGSFSTNDIGGTAGYVEAIVDIQAQGSGRGFVSYEFRFEGADMFNGATHVFTERFAKGAYGENVQFSKRFPTWLLTSYTISVRNLVVSATAPAVPEPETWAMLIFGFGTIGVSLRRKRRIDQRLSTNG